MDTASLEVAEEDSNEPPLLVPAGANLPTDSSIPSSRTDETKENGEKVDAEEEDDDDGSCTIAPSMRSMASTIPPEVIRQRVRAEAMRKQKQQEKRKIKVKGNASAIRRGRKENQNVIAQYDGWDDFS